MPNTLQDLRRPLKKETPKKAGVPIKPPEQVPPAFEPPMPSPAARDPIASFADLELDEFYGDGPELVENFVTGGGE